MSGTAGSRKHPLSKRLILLVAFSLCLAATGCGNDNEQASDNSGDPQQKYICERTGFIYDPQNPYPEAIPSPKPFADLSRHWRGPNGETKDEFVPLGQP
jgi:rubredoxin